MKKNLVFVLLLVSVTIRGQNVLRVNNIPGISVPYTTIQAAVTAANAGDIILVEGTPFNYAGVVLTKKLTMQGPGYFLSENTPLQATQTPATIINGFELGPGSDGSVVSGLTFNCQVNVSTSNISFTNNRLIGNTGLQLTNTSTASNLLISDNYFESGNWSITSANNNQTFTGVVISNNYISLRIQWTGPAPVFASIKNNILAYTNQNLSNSDVENNIFLFNDNTFIGLFSGTVNATIRYNIFITTPIPQLDGTNTFGASSVALFVGLSGNTSDTQWRLKAGSVAIGGGEGGLDCGIYGGVTPYKISGVASGLSTISNFTVPGTVPQNGTLNVKVSAKVN